jgi:hypothetical protein
MNGMIMLQSYSRVLGVMDLAGRKGGGSLFFLRTFWVGTPFLAREKKNLGQLVQV